MAKRPGTAITPVTESQMAFAANIGRAQAFLSIFDSPGGKPRGRGTPTANEKELLRAAVVFGIAALDAYLHDLVLEEVPKRGVQDETLTEALKAIAKDDPALALRVALADSAKERRAEFRHALDGWLSAKSFQGPEAVVRALGFVGHSTTAMALDSRIGTGWTDRLSGWTKMRHGMVHRAERPYVRRPEAGKCIELVRQVVEAVDRIVAGEPIVIDH